MGDEPCDTVCKYFFFVCVIVHLNVFARNTTPDVWKGVEEGQYGGKRAKEQESEDTSKERKTEERFGDKLIGAGG